MNTSALAGFYEKYGFKGLARSLATTAAGAPAANAESADPASSAKRDRDLFDEPEATPALAPTATAVSTVRYDTVLTWEAFDSWLARILSLIHI